MTKKITITFKDAAKADEIRDTIINNMGEPKYQDTIEDPDWKYDSENPTLPKQVPNPVSRDKFFKNHIINMIKNQYSRAKRSALTREVVENIENEDLTLS